MDTPEQAAQNLKLAELIIAAREAGILDRIRDFPTPEQAARDLLERLGIEDAQSWTAGDLVELANLIAGADFLRVVLLAVEWIYTEWGEQCPRCHRTRMEGHRSDCDLAAALRRSSKREET